MLFNSFTFGIFLSIVFLIYWGLLRRSVRAQNLLLLSASYLFYGWWDWRFLSLIALSSVVDFAVGQGLATVNGNRARKWLLGVSLAVNLGMLALFKYYNFFIETAVSLLSSLGFSPNIFALQIILPVGISFYTFQTLSYTIDIYRRKIKPTQDIIAFFAFVSFFPQLVAGPIERAADLLPQFLKPRVFDSALARSGLRMMLWGLFKKVVIADNLAPVVDRTFANYSTLPTLTLIIGVLFFAFQIYCDFSGYSEIAVGSARLIGFNLTQNFNYPYLSRNVGEFWRRWHITLSSWFRDYLYIPLGGSRTSTRWRHLLNLIITFTLSGLWHGANWTFVSWGVLHGLFYLPIVFSGQNRQYRGAVIASDRLWPTWHESLSWFTTFVFVSLAWVFFRAATIEDAFLILGRIFNTELWRPIILSPNNRALLLTIGTLFFIEWIQRNKEFPLDIAHYPLWMRWLIYYGIIGCILFYRAGASTSFIYFQF